MKLRTLFHAKIDLLLAVMLGVAYVALLLSTVGDLGYARDEGFYYQAARSYERWFDLLLSQPSAALEPKAIDRYWGVNHEHPALMKSLFALSLRYLHDRWQWFGEAGTAARFPGMVVSALGVSFCYVWGRQTLSRMGGLVAALLFALMPRVFYHSHLDCFDVPVASLLLVTTYVYWRSLGSGSFAWPVLTGVLYGLLLNTKHNSWLLPAALIVHWLMVRGRAVTSELRTGRLSIPSGLLAMVLIGPAVFYATWPWIWHDTGQRLAEYVSFHTGHEYYNMEFLGHTYWKPPMPLAYAWVMTLATVPAITLVLFLVGLFDGARQTFGDRVVALSGRVARSLRRRRRRSKVPSKPDEAAATRPPPVVRSDATASDGSGGDSSDPAVEVVVTTRSETPPEVEDESLLPSTARSLQDESPLAPRAPLASSTEWLWVLCLLTAYAPWLSPNTPIFGGTKHWLAAYPFLCLFAARGFGVVATRLERLIDGRLPAKLSRRGAVPVALLVCVVSAPAAITLGSHPWGLTAYTPLVGSAPGAANLGLNRTFWGYTTGAVQDFVNEAAAPNARVYVHDTALQSFNLMRHDGRLRDDLIGTLNIHESALALYHHEPHMRRVEHQVWVDYGTTAPAHVAGYQGVPVVWVYQRPQNAKQPAPE
jgi:hypothetical protein